MPIPAIRDRDWDFHLHFEARKDYTAGNILNGTGFPVRALIGNWWNPWYAPPPDQTATPIHDEANYSGGAQQPEDNTPPALMPVPGNTSTPGPRHLAGSNSPSDFPSGYASNISISQVTLHMGAAPDAPGTSSDANFQIQEYQPSQLLNPWVILENFWGKPTYTRALIQVIQRCGANGQYCYTVRSRTSSKPLTSPRYVDIHPGIPGSKPHIAAFYNINQATVTLEYVWPGALRYIVYERHGGQTFIAHDGQASQVTVNRILGNAPNVYQVSVQISALQWINSEWLYLHNQIVVIPASTPTRTPTRTPTPVGTPTWPAYDPDCSDGQCVFQVTNYNDDAGTNATCAYSVFHQEVYLGKCSSQGMVSGFRFPGVNLQQGAQIAEAYLAVWADGPYSNPLEVRFYGEASDGAAVFSNQSKPSDRPLTTAFVNWVVPASDQWPGPPPGEPRFTPYITAIVQEIVNRSGWVSGNDLAIIVKDVNSTNYRRVFAFDREDNTNHTARLVITLTNP